MPPRFPTMSSNFPSLPSTLVNIFTLERQDGHGEDLSIRAGLDIHLLHWAMADLLANDTGRTRGTDRLDDS
jgi:hypothetical protein